MKTRLLVLLLIALLMGAAPTAFGQAPPLQFDSIRALTALTQAQPGPKRGPWLSADGLRLYYQWYDPVQSVLSGTFVASRPTLTASFANPQPVPGLAHTLATFSEDELTAWYVPDSLIYTLAFRTRPSLTSSFGPRQLVSLTGPGPVFLSEAGFLAPALSSDGQELMIVYEYPFGANQLCRYRRTGPTVFTSAEVWFDFIGGVVNPGMGTYFDQDRRYVFGAYDPNQQPIIYELHRPTAADSFGQTLTTVVLAAAQWPADGAASWVSYRPQLNLLVMGCWSRASSPVSEFWCAQRTAGPQAAPPNYFPLQSLTPNPATTTVTLTGATPGPVTLLDAVGRAVRTTTIAPGQTSAVLDVRGLPAGLYLVRSGATTKRLVVE